MMDFLQDIGLFDPTKAETGTPLYENMVLMVQRSNLSAKILTVGLVQNLAKLVVVVPPRNKRRKREVKPPNDNI